MYPTNNLLCAQNVFINQPVSGEYVGDQAGTLHKHDFPKLCECVNIHLLYMYMCVGLLWIFKCGVKVSLIKGHKDYWHRPRIDGCLEPESPAITKGHGFLALSCRRLVRSCLLIVLEVWGREITEKARKYKRTNNVK